jgi:hypothetical protein
MSCPCDKHAADGPIDIPPGLDVLPLQRLGFPETIALLLAAIPGEPWLDPWRARSDHDFGRMLLEMWAYVADVLSFYDQVRAGEIFLRTAVLRQSLRRIVDLIGHLPRPAVGATVDLALLADGRRPLVLPAGIAFRSGAFGAEPPQVFETGAAATITLTPMRGPWCRRARPRSRDLHPPCSWSGPPRGYVPAIGSS